MDQPRFERLLRLMHLMSGPRRYTIQDLQEQLHVSERKIYRYIDTFKAAGFAVVKDQENVFRLTSTGEIHPDLSDIVFFTEEEAIILERLINALDEWHSYGDNLKRKLAAIFDVITIAEYLNGKAESRAIRTLTDAIKEKKAVILRNYGFTLVNDKDEHKAEMYAFTTDYEGVWGYDQEDEENILFKVSQINEVIILEESWRFESRHISSPVDVFRTSGPNSYHIRLQLTSRARDMLIAEYPLTREFQRKNGDKFQFD